MCKGILGKKLGMTGLYTSKGRYMPVTVLMAGPCVITQIKSEKVDGYEALQLGFEEKKVSRVNKPIQGHIKKSGDRFFSYLKEFPAENIKDYSIGQEVTVKIFNIGEKVNISGITKGRGFAGVVKRYNFSGGPKSHGGMCNRLPGSIGASAWPSRVVKGKKLPGHHGNKQVTIRNLEVVDIKYDDNILIVKGAIPGFNSNLVQIKKMLVKREV